MCGIAGFLGSDLEVGRAVVARCVGQLAHRGPDDNGLFAADGVVFGHRRLSIIDLSSAGHQPMTSADGRWTLSYNGEVYNHLQVRSKLEHDWQFRSRTDTETVLAALAIEGPAALEGMVGMWALALWDGHEQRLLLSRDRYGQKPLYWRRRADKSFRFASEIRPLLDEGERVPLHAPAVSEFLATGNYGHLGERTFFEDVYAFPPAHWAYVSERDAYDVSPRRYWRFPVAPDHERRPYDDAARRRFRDAFEEAVSSQLMSDVPVGATLSGGLDSSAIVGAMVSHAPATPIQVFTAQAEGSAFDESQYVRAVVSKWGSCLNVNWTRLERMRLSSVLADAICAQEEPFGDPSIIAHGFLMDAAKAADIPVLLAGQGGDELLFGYPFMSNALIASALRHGSVRWAFREARGLEFGGRTWSRALLSAVAPRLERRARMRSRTKRGSWLSPALVEAADNDLELVAQSDATAVWLEAVERVALPHLTHYDDRSGMRRSIEGRMPFLDHRLADVVGELEYDAFLDGGLRKRILRDACADLLPESVAARPDKVGFYTPLVEMLAAESVWAATLVSDDFAHELGVYDVRYIRTLAQALGRGEGDLDAALCVWRALVVRVWAEEFGASFARCGSPRAGTRVVNEFSVETV